MNKQEAAAYFAGIIAENKTGNPRGIHGPACAKCKKWKPKTMTCSLYPEKIPGEIFWHGKKTCLGMESKQEK